jgi:CheY-specific phosphatase CheX
MQGYERSIHDIAQNIFGSVLGFEVEMGDPFRASRGEPTLAGVVQISGKWEGAVALLVTLPLARRAAISMLGIDDGEVSSDDQRDAVGELGNIVGGNFKALLP